MTHTSLKANHARGVAHHEGTKTRSTGSRKLLCASVSSWLTLFVVLSSPSHAMFIANPEKEHSIPVADTPGSQSVNPTGTTAASHAKRVPDGSEAPAPQPSSESAERTARELQRNIEDVALRPMPAQTRRSHSNAYARMSGQTSDFRPVTSSAAETRDNEPELPVGEQIVTKEEKLFDVLSWAFVLGCVAAASLAVLRIKHLTARA